MPLDGTETHIEASTDVTSFYMIRKGRTNYKEGYCKRLKGGGPCAGEAMLWLYNSSEAVEWQLPIHPAPMLPAHVVVPRESLALRWGEVQIDEM